MKIVIKNKIVPIAQRMVKGIQPTKSEIQFLRDASTEAQDLKFKAVLQSIGNESLLRLRRKAGRELLNKIRFATGARRKNDLPSDNPRPEKIKRWLKQDKLLRSPILIALFLTAIFLTSCATTQYQGVDVSKLTDQQLAEELVSAEQGLGQQTDYRSALLAIDTSPRIVVTGASTTYSGNLNAQYNSANQTLYGSFKGSGYTTYQSVDMNGGARFAKNLSLIINASNSAKLESRRTAVVAEISHRQASRASVEQITAQFMFAHPDIAANQNLLIACLLITQHRTGDALEQLQQAAEIMHTLPQNRWIGWVEAHGDPRYPYGVVAGSYAMDTVWDGDTLTGKGKASDRSELTLTAKRKQDGTIEGNIRSQTMEASFIGRMTESALCVDYTGTESGQPIRGITWAFRNVETNHPPTVPTSATQTQSAISPP